MKKLIILSAKRHINKYGFRKFTMDDIANDLGVSKKTLYKHYESKDQMISSLIDHFIQEEYLNTDQAIDEAASPKQKLRAALLCNVQNQFLINEIQELKKYYPLEWAKVQELYDFKMKRVRRLIELGMERGEVRTGLSIDSLCIIIEMVMEGMLDNSLLEKYDKTAMQAIEDIKNILLNGILEEKGDRNEKEKCF